MPLEKRIFPFPNNCEISLAIVFSAARAHLNMQQQKKCRWLRANLHFIEFIGPISDSLTDFTGHGTWEGWGGIQIESCGIV